MTSLISRTYYEHPHIIGIRSTVSERRMKKTIAKVEADPEVDPQGFEIAWEKYKVQCAEEKQNVLDIGGLYIIGTERHESRRIDNQLRGRSGRQGDPGKSRFYLCFQDDLLRIFGSDKLIGWYERMGMKDDEPIEHSWVTSQIESAQKKVEGHNFNMRKNLLEYDDVMNLQRSAIYEKRKKALKGEDIRDMILEAIRSLVDDVISQNMDPDVRPEEWNIEGSVKIWIICLLLILKNLILKLGIWLLRKFVRYSMIKSLIYMNKKNL